MGKIGYVVVDKVSWKLRSLHKFLVTFQTSNPVSTAEAQINCWFGPVQVGLRLRHILWEPQHKSSKEKEMQLLIRVSIRALENSFAWCLSQERSRGKPSGTRFFTLVLSPGSQALGSVPLKAPYSTNDCISSRPWQRGYEVFAQGEVQHSLM